MLMTATIVTLLVAGDLLLPEPTQVAGDQMWVIATEVVRSLQTRTLDIIRGRRYAPG